MCGGGRDMGRVGGGSGGREVDYSGCMVSPLCTALSAYAYNAIWYCSCCLLCVFYFIFIIKKKKKMCVYVGRGIIKVDYSVCMVSPLCTDHSVHTYMQYDIVLVVCFTYSFFALLLLLRRRIKKVKVVFLSHSCANNTD